MMSPDSREAANIEILEVINNHCELLKEGLHVVPSLTEASKSESGNPCIRKIDKKLMS